MSISKEDMIRLKEEAKSMLRPYLESQGINTNKNFSCLSIDHADSNPSMTYNEKTNTVYCFGCGEHGDIFDIIRMQYDIPKNDYKTIFETTYKVLGINTNIYQKNTQILPRKKIQIQENTTEKSKEKELDLVEYFKNAEKNINETDYAKKRGLTEEIIKKFHLGFDPNWINSKLDEETKKKIKPSPRLIIPTSEHSYLARNTKDKLTEKEKKYSKIKVGKIRIFNQEILNKTQSPIFVVEGEIDAMSIMVAGGEAVGLGSASNTELFIKECKKNPPQMSLIICADNDETGKKAMAKLCLGLAKEKIPFVYSNINKNYKDANERLVNDSLGLKKDVSFMTNRIKNIFYEKNKKNSKILTNEELKEFYIKDLNNFRKVFDGEEIISLLNKWKNENIENKEFYDAYDFAKKQEIEAVRYKDISEDLDFDIHFMEKVVKIHGTNGDILQNAIEAISDYKNENSAFEAKLLHDTLRTKEYKEAFDAKQLYINENTR